MISKFSVRKPYTVLVGVVLAIVLGVVSFTRMTADLLPSISLPYVIVVTTYPGASPETVETAVTQPVEAAMATVSNIEGISSVSSENYSMVILEFAQTADMNAVSLEIRESLDQIKSYWDDMIGNPIIMKLNPDMLPIMIAAVGMDGMDYAEISTYVQDSIMPELESLEGVASVSATGLLEESVNVIIRQEKVDKVNALIFASIDEKMAEAEQELEDAAQEIVDGRKELENGRKELLNGKKELNNGRQELEQGKKELEDGKKELENQQNAMANQLATQKAQLTAAKTNLEKIQSDLTTAKTLDEGIKQIDAILQPPLTVDSFKTYEKQINELALASTFVNKYSQYISAWLTAMKNNDADNATVAASAITDLQNDFSTNYKRFVQILSMSGLDSSGKIASLLSEDPWCPESLEDERAAEEKITTVRDGLDAVQKVAAQIQPVLRYDDMKAALAALTNGLGYDAYYNLIFGELSKQNIKNLTDLTNAIKSLDNALLQIEQGQMTAAIEFANGKAQIALGEYQLELAESQLDAGADQLQAGLDQMDDALKQLDDAEEQLNEGREQLADAKESAYEQADMSNILTVDTVKGLLTAQNFSMPAGYVTEDGIDYLVRVGDKPSTVEDLQALPLMDLHMDGVPVITLGDVADVFYTDNSESIYTNVDGSAGVMLTIQKQTGYSTGEVSDRLGERFEELMEENQGLTMITLMDQGIYIDLVMDSIINNILFGGVLAILILLVFLKDLRPTLVVAFAIPISLVTAIVCMYFSGVTLNIISLSGLALGIGMLVDNSIVVIENIYRMRNEGMSVQEAATEGAREVAGAILASTLTTVCVFLPIVFTEGITRQLFVDMGLTIAYSLLASLVIALTVVPAMSSKMLTRTKEQKPGRIFEGLVNVYEKLLRGALHVKSLVIVLVVAMLVISVALAFTNGTAFMSDMDSTQLTVSVNLGEEATLQETAEVTNQVVEAILSIEDVKNVGAMTSSNTMSLLGGGGGSVNRATVYVVTEDDKTMSNEEIARQIQEKTAGLNAEIRVDTSSMDMSALGGSGISIQVRGRELDTIQRIAGEVAAIIESVEGTADVSDGLEEADEELRIIINKDEAVHYGLTVAQVYAQIYPKLAAASSATTLVASDKDYSVYVMNGNDIELTRELVQQLEINGTDEEGKSVEIPLSEIADFEKAYALTSINRTAQTRYVSVTAAIAKGYNVGLVSADVNEKLADYEVPAGYQLVFSGENETINDAMEQVMLMMLLAVLFMYLIMVAQFQSLLSPFIIMFTIPLAFTGGFLGLFISGSEVSVIAMIGFVMLAGIIVNNGIVLIDYMNQLRESGMEKREAILTAGRTRLRPVLMTALTTILALSTMVFSQDMGAEMAKPMAVVTIGGLLYGTLLTLVVIPCIYDIFIRDGRGGKRKEKRRLFTKRHDDLLEMEGE
ncbi:MAG: efflux RND transporter permease subunit [Acetatifactor sp.]|nr:efflux RND transporter permease subunit [Acetatifactor sp.]